MGENAPPPHYQDAYRAVQRDLARAVEENEKLRALVTRLTEKLEDMGRSCPDSGADLDAAIYCGRHFIYG